MTEETQAEPTVQTEPISAPDASTKSKDTKKDKCRPMTKVVVRRLPPSMTREQFVEQTAPLPDHDYLHFVKADLSMGQFSFSRAYINFLDQRDIFIFREKFDNYVFVDSKGAEYPAVVEFAPFQRLPKKRVGKKKDPKCGTLKTDPYYVSFLESLKNLEADSAPTQPKTEYSYQPSDGLSKKVTTTPLLEFLKQRKQEKQRLRDEKREERRRRDLERRKAKDEVTVSKVLKNPDLGKEAPKEVREAKEEKDKSLPKEAKNRAKREEKQREKTSRDRDGKSVGKNFKEKENARSQRRGEEKKLYARKEGERVDGGSKEERKTDARGEERKTEAREEAREAKDRKLEQKRGKSYEKMRQEKKRLAEAKKMNVDGVGEASSSASRAKREEGSSSKKEKRIESSAKGDKIQILRDESRRKEDKNRATNEHEESREEGDATPSEGRENESEAASPLDDYTIECSKSKSNDRIDSESNYVTDAEIKEGAKLAKRRSSLESGGEGGGGDGGTLRRHKSLDGGDQHYLKKSENDGKEKSKRDPRPERRIRNKDRPAMEIYRPGMGKFSKQRLERESSKTDDQASLSQSPTPSPVPSTTSKTTKSGSEVRSMTFKRSASRDLP